MTPRNVHELRNYVLWRLSGLKRCVSRFPDYDEDALLALTGSEEIKTIARITDFVLEQLGHTPPAMTAAGTSPTVRAARKILRLTT